MKKEILLKNEFNLLCDLLNGHPKMERTGYFSDKHWSKNDLSKTPYWRDEMIRDIIESIELRGLDQKWDVDISVFIDKLFEAIKTNDFTYLLEEVELFWKKKYPLGHIKNN